MLQKGLKIMIRRWQTLVLLVAVIAGAGLGAVGLATWSRMSSSGAAQQPAPSKPDNRILTVAQGGVATGAPSASTDALIRQYIAAARSRPNDPTSFTNLALAYMQKERETGDVTYYKLTDDAARTA